MKKSTSIFLIIIVLILIIGFVVLINQSTNKTQTKTDDTPTLDRANCIQNSDCKWESGLPESVGGCGCFNKDYLNQLEIKYDENNVVECEPTLNIEKPCICVSEECQINLNTETDCEKLESEVKNLIEEVKSCESDSDCFMDTSTHLGCPFGCSFIRSHGYDDGEYLLLIQTKVDQYHNDCPICKYKCPVAPEPKDIKCVNNKCSDVRFTK